MGDAHTDRVLTEILYELRALRLDLKMAAQRPPAPDGHFYPLGSDSAVPVARPESSQALMRRNGVISAAE